MGDGAVAPGSVLAFHEEKLRRRAEAVDYGNDPAVQSVYEISESLEKLIPLLRDVTGRPAVVTETEISSLDSTAVVDCRSAHGSNATEADIIAWRRSCNPW